MSRRLPHKQQERAPPAYPGREAKECLPQSKKFIKSFLVVIVDCRLVCGGGGGGGGGGGLFCSVEPRSCQTIPCHGDLWPKLCEPRDIFYLPGKFGISFCDSATRIVGGEADGHPIVYVCESPDGDSYPQPRNLCGR